MPCYRFHGDQMMPHVIEIARIVSDEELAEMSTWCTDPGTGVTGWFDYKRLNHFHKINPKVTLEFRFSDLTTATYFKLRWS